MENEKQLNIENLKAVLKDKIQLFSNQEFGKKTNQKFVDQKDIILLLKYFVDAQQYEFVFEIEKDHFKIISLLPLAAIQYVRALRINEKYALCDLYLDKIRILHKKNFVIHLLSAENAIDCGKISKANELFEIMQKFKPIPIWSLNTYIKIFSNYITSASSSTSFLIENIFFGDLFTTNQKNEHKVALQFLIHMSETKNINQPIFKSVKETIFKSNFEDNSKSIITRFLIEGELFQFTEKRIKALNLYFEEIESDECVELLSWRMRPFQNFNFKYNEEFLLSLGRNLSKKDNGWVSKIIDLLLSNEVGTQNNNSAASQKNNNKDLENLKIAFCISGQLRGFEKCFPEWKQSEIFKKFNVKVFVSTWYDVGRKTPNRMHADRVFSGKFLETYRNQVAMLGGLEVIERKYPNFNMLLNKSDKISIEKLETFFQTKDIEIFDEQNPQFSGFSNQEKMFFQIYNCMKMAIKSQDNFDIVIRIRPDLSFIYPTDYSWEQLFRNCISSGSLIVDSNLTITYPHGLFVGDQFAVGVPEKMKIYSDLYLQAQSLPNKFIDSKGKIKPHCSLACHVITNGVLIDRISLSNGRLLDPNRLSNEDIKIALEQDIEKSKLELDPLWSALKDLPK